MTVISHPIKASKKSYSFRTTIPQEIVEALKMSDTDVLQWEVVKEKGKVYAKMKKVIE
jgi:bifunctional DNA-binding transcriptional regulator/antitoxin component of YhaV-PrlF toxin-antitoxin module